MAGSGWRKIRRGAFGDDILHWYAYLSIALISRCEVTVSSLRKTVMNIELVFCNDAVY